MQAGTRKRPKYIVVTTDEIDVPSFRMQRYEKPEQMEPVKARITPKVKCGYFSFLSAKIEEFSSSRKLRTSS